MEHSSASHLFDFDDPLDAVGRVFSSRCGPKVQQALIYVLEGAGYREAARRAGVRDHKQVFDAARRLYLMELHDERQAERRAMRFSKADRRAIEATLDGDPTPKQALRAYSAAMKRLEP